jgi:hypothetical protein
LPGFAVTEECADGYVACSLHALDARGWAHNGVPGERVGEVVIGWRRDSICGGSMLLTVSSFRHATRCVLNVD